MSGQQHSYAHLDVVIDAGVARVTIDNPPVNVLNVALVDDVTHLLTSLRDDSSTRVIVFASADPEYFIAHVDMTIAQDTEAVGRLMSKAPAGLNPFQALNELLRHQPQITIAKLAGIARGGGAEFVTACDLAFGAAESAGLGQIEALMGIVPGGGGTQYLSRRVGRNRALEIVLGAELYDAQTAERYGWLNRALPADALDAFVDRLAGNIAALPDGVVAAAKAAIVPEDLVGGMVRESEAWMGQVFLPATTRIMADGLAAGAQTADGERDLEGLLRNVHIALAG